VIALLQNAHDTRPAVYLQQWPIMDHTGRRARTHHSRNPIFPRHQNIPDLELGRLGQCLDDPGPPAHAARPNRGMALDTSWMDQEGKRTKVEPDEESFHPVVGLVATILDGTPNPCPAHETARVVALTAVVSQSVAEERIVPVSFQSPVNH
jgi:hypothetical protein